MCVDVLHVRLKSRASDGLSPCLAMHCPFVLLTVAVQCVCGTLCLQDLMKKTIGPLKESFIIYNSSAASKGMAVVTFHRATDAAKAREKYHGKVIDQRELHLSLHLTYC